MQNLRLVGVVLSPFALMLASGIAVAAQQVEVYPEVNHGVSAPVRLLSFDPLAGQINRPHMRIPGASVSTARPEDPAVQDLVGSDVSTTPGLSVLGIGKGFTGPNGTFAVQYAPPDTNAAVGTTQVAEVVNLS